MEVLTLFKDLIEHNVYPPSWNAMIMLQNSVIMKILRLIAHTIRDQFHGANFEETAWSNFFRCAISFIRQDSLQMENFSENKRLRISKTYKDMRVTMGMEVKQMWFNLGQNKIHFVPDLIGDFLELALVKETERKIMKSTIQIFFDMIQCEYYSPRFNKSSESLVIQDGSQAAQADFREFKKEFITRLDSSIAQDGLGDDLFMESYKNIMRNLCQKHTSICDPGTEYVDITGKLIKLLLNYRFHSNDSKENQMSCIVNLLFFYQEIGREDLYEKYLRELADLHLKYQNHAESGFTILQYARRLAWTYQPLIYKWGKYNDIKTHRELKEQLYKDIIELFDKGKMWEKAIEICEELCLQYKTETFDYGQLSEIYKKMSKFYSDMLTQNEAKRMPEYFRVAYIGKGFPAFLQNKTFIYRGKGCDILKEFEGRILEQFPNADLVKKMEAPTEDEKNGLEQKIQIISVTPMMNGDKPEWEGKSLSPQLLKYYEKNDVKQFYYDKSFRRGPKGVNEFANLWISRTILETRESFPTILQWLPVDDEPTIVELSPIEVAIDFMEKSNKRLKMSIQDTELGGIAAVKSLSGLINGTISE